MNPVVPETFHIHPLCKISIPDIFSTIADKLTVLVDVPIVQWLVLKIDSRGFGTLEVSKSLTPNILAVFDSIDYFGVKWQRAICFGDQAGRAKTFK